MNSKTIDFFKEISKIPRESGNEKEISNYIVKFAKERNLEYIKDEFNNVIIKKYYFDTEPIILQAHLDMVCEKEEGNDFDFSKDSLELVFEDDFISARGTTLGADNGIGVAQILNVLDSDIKRSIEAVFTVCEETTMNGATEIDLSSLKGRKMINLDGFNSDTVLIESASFTDIDIITKNYLKENSSGNLYKVKLFGLKGGHSGFDIDKNRGNAILFLANFLLKLKDLRIASFNGGSKINVIPFSSEAIIETKEDIYTLANEFINECSKYIDFDIEVCPVLDSKMLLSYEDSICFINSILSIRHGVFFKNVREEVTTSLNFALVNLENNLIQIGLRSSILGERELVIDYLSKYCDEYDYKFNIIGYQPGFSISEDSELVQKMKKCYYKINNKYPEVKSVHIAVEVGLIKEKINDLDVVIISPYITGAHTPEEKVSISSILSCDNWLLEYLNDV